MKLREVIAGAVTNYCGHVGKPVGNLPFACAKCNAIIDEVRDALARQEGWKFTPRIPTQEMMTAGVYGGQFDRAPRREQEWKDMHDASPSVGKEEQEERIRELEGLGLDALAAEGQWIELTGKQDAEIGDLRRKVRVLEAQLAVAMGTKDG